MALSLDVVQVLVNWERSFKILLHEARPRLLNPLKDKEQVVRPPVDSILADLRILSDLEQYLGVASLELLQFGV